MDVQQMWIRIFALYRRAKILGGVRTVIAISGVIVRYQLWRDDFVMKVLLENFPVTSIRDFLNLFSDYK